MKKVLVVFGTRPEAIKMCPLVIELKKNSKIDCKVCLTGQHKEMLKQVMDAFDIVEDYNLDIMKERQTLTTITTTILERLEPILIDEAPDVVLVHGDTTTSYAAAMAAFYQKIPVGHVEAGLRTGDIYSPFPEEMNRLLTDRVSAYHFAPTESNRENLLKEGIEKTVFVTGNTVIDAFKYTVKENYTYKTEKLNDVDFDAEKVILLTAHRRENQGRGIENICNAVKRLALENNDITFIYPVHLSPAVRETVFPILSNMDNVLLIDPIDVLDMHNIMSKCYMVMTDSGGIQEEAPHFGKPVLVLRTETERPEAVEAGTVMLAGVEKENVKSALLKLLLDKDAYTKMSHAINPYGDGHASEKIIEILKK